MSNKPKRKPKALTVSQLGRKAKSKKLIEVPLIIDGEECVIMSRPVSLGISEKFAELNLIEDPREKGMRGIPIAKEFIATHLRNPDGSEPSQGDLESVLDSLDAEFAVELSSALMEYISGSKKVDEDESKKVEDSTSPSNEESP